VNAAKISLFTGKENSGLSVQGCWQILSLKLLDLKYNMVDKSQEVAESEKVLWL